MKFTKVRKRRFFANLYLTNKDMELSKAPKWIRCPSVYNMLIKRTDELAYLEETKGEFFHAKLRVSAASPGLIGITSTVSQGFSFDGATGCPDKWILRAALFHDAFGRNLSKKYRPMNDELFRVLVAEDTNPFYARLLWIGVRAYSILS